MIHFAFDKSVLDAVSKNKIDSSIQNIVLKEVLVSAHCDSLGNNPYNDALSLRRAAEVKHYLVSKGVPDTLIKINGFGKKVPLNRNETKEARTLNRRAEIVFISVPQEPLRNSKIQTDTLIQEVD